MAGIREAGGDRDGALDLLNQAAGVYDGDFSPKCGGRSGLAGAGVGRAGAQSVNNRRAAVHRAEELDLLSRTPNR
jgi:hypothetical protein